jgi:hypothetical protein
MNRPSKQRFPLGQVLATPGALEALEASGETIHKFLARHASGDWGDIDQEDKDANERSLLDGSRLLSAYRTAKGEKLWIITEADRSSSTALLPQSIRGASTSCDGSSSKLTRLRNAAARSKPLGTAILA